MKQDTVRGKQQASSNDVGELWATLLSNDVTGIDGDIETLVGLLQKRHRYGHDKAAAVLVRRLSTFCDNRRDPS